MTGTFCVIIDRLRLRVFAKAMFMLANLLTVLNPTALAIAAAVVLAALGTISYLKGWKFIFEFVVVIAAALALSFVVRTFVVGVYEVPSGSMESTIEVGDRILSEKISYRFSQPAKGDIITFENPTDEDVVLVKRVIATAGDVVDISNGNLYINGELQNEPYTSGKPTYELTSAYDGKRISYPYAVPEGHVWVMGDNRTNSSDSRYFGSVPTSTITGRVFFRYWPFDRFGIM